MSNLLSWYAMRPEAGMKFRRTARTFEDVQDLIGRDLEFWIGVVSSYANFTAKATGFDKNMILMTKRLICDVSGSGVPHLLLVENLVFNLMLGKHIVTGIEYGELRNEFIWPVCWLDPESIDAILAAPATLEFFAREGEGGEVMHDFYRRAQAERLEVYMQSV